MSLVHVEDQDGKTIRLMEMDGRRYPAFPADSLKHATEIEARPDDVLLVTFPKSGTHWVGAIIRYLVTGNTVAPGEKEFISSFVDMAQPDVINGLPMDRPRDLTTHFHADVLSPDFIRKKCKIIYVTRNPRDAVTSYFHHHKKLKAFYEYEGEWSGHFQLFIEGKLDYNSWFEHTKGWEKCIKDNPDNQFLVLSFEGLKQDPFGNIKKISDFIGMNHSEEFLKEVVTRTSFKSMAVDLNAGMGSVMMRKGEVGDWKNNFTVAQSEIFNDMFEKEMVGTDAYKLYSHTVEK